MKNKNLLVYILLFKSKNIIICELYGRQPYPIEAKIKHLAYLLPAHYQEPYFFLL